MTALGWVVPALPFAAALVGFLASGRSARVLAGIAIGGTAGSGVCAVALLLGTGSGTVRTAGLLLAPTGSVPIGVGVRIDPLAASVTVMVCAVALAVQIYSTAYLRGEPRYAAYAAEVSLFTAAMLTVVLASDLVELLVGWEVMGVCSYLLIGHYWQTAEAAGAAVKAFLVTRIGDVAFLFGIFTIGLGVHSFALADVLARGPRLPPATLVAGTLLLVGGVLGKSAQFPLHVWLPDAMAGPTPISALIHAATMVAAGVYLVARLDPLFAAAGVTRDVLAVVAAVSMVLAGLAACVQDDMKRVLAYSTISQLAYLVGGLAVGAVLPAVFHLIVHAAFKALLFLAAGAVLRAVGTNLMSQMGGLRRGLPVTFATTTIGLAALVGLPPTSGFFSKDAVLAAAYDAARAGSPAAGLVFAAGLVTVLLTAGYATRLWLRTFFGEYRGSPAGGPAGPVGVQDPPPAMRWPLVALAVPAGLLGLVGLGHPLAGWYGVAGAPLDPQFGTAAASLLLAAVGIAAVVLRWRAAPAADPAEVLPAGLRRAMGAGFGVDTAYAALFVRPAYAVARTVRRAEEQALEPLVAGAGAGATLLGGAVRRLQNGNVQRYLTVLLAGVVVGAVALAVLG